MKEIIIRPDNRWPLLDILEIWRYRELLYIFTWRDIKVRYKQTVLGVIWVIFQPIVSSGIFSIFFGKLAKIQSGDLPYPLFVFTGLVFWLYFSNSLSRISESMILEQNLIKKIYFPKVILPLSIIITNTIDLLINLIVLIIFSSIIGYIPNLMTIIIFPFIFLVSTITSLGFGLILASLNVKYRDVRYVLPFFIQLFLFLTPVIYPLGIVDEKNKLIMAINPMTSVIEMARFCFSPNMQIYSHLTLISVLSSLVLLILGLWYFRKTEKYFADIV